MTNSGCFLLVFFSCCAAAVSSSFYQTWLFDCSRSSWPARTNTQPFLHLKVPLLSFVFWWIVPLITFLVKWSSNSSACRVFLLLLLLLLFFKGLRSSTAEVSEGQHKTNSLESLGETGWDGNCESRRTRLLWLLELLQQFFCWMSAPNHNYLISVMFPLSGCEWLNWIHAAAASTPETPSLFFSQAGSRRGIVDMHILRMKVQKEQSPEK